MNQEKPIREERVIVTEPGEVEALKALYDKNNLAAGNHKDRLVFTADGLVYGDSQTLQASAGRLTGLCLNDAKLFDLNPLAGLTALTKLDLRYNNIKNLSPLTDLAALTKLSLG
jgi:Leucine-rich repeat (LRR) protein